MLLGTWDGHPKQLLSAVETIPRCGAEKGVEAEMQGITSCSVDRGLGDKWKTV